ncbi:MAG: hypothetical protein QM785_10485 [Pyrinomonadaceae bacterium]
MKRWILGFLVFPVAFWLGTAIVSFYHVRDAKVDYCPVTEKAANPITELAPEIDLNVVEFRDLPNYDEIDYPVFNEKLLDISNGGDIFSTPEDLPTKSGDEWLTLTQVRQGTLTLKTSEIRIRKFSSKEMGDGQLRVSFRNATNPILALRNLKSVRPGNIQTLHFDPSEENETDETELMEDGFHRQFDLAGTTYVIRVSRGVTKARENVAVLVISDGKVEQVIDYSPIWPGSKPNLGHLIWAGDLDLDGKLDLYVDRSLGEEKSGTGLFLSSHAKSGTLIKLAALFGHTGC